LENCVNDFLPEPLPADPLSIFGDWLDHARSHSGQPNPDAMVLATVGSSGQPSARVVLCKQFILPAGYVVFFTNYESRKGHELQQNPRAAAAFHWDQLRRQIRIEGPLVQSPAEESDRYFASRPLQSRLGAWASRQSEPVASRSALQAQLDAVKHRFGIQDGSVASPIPRPPHWGGFRLFIERLELWVEGPGRIHDRAVWQRILQPSAAGEFQSSAWSATRLNP
jgi:pyridoxamine 5'-phosphate oxidase